MNDAVIVSAVRTAIGRGKSDGALANITPIDLSALVMQEAVKRANIDPQVDRRRGVGLRNARRRPRTQHGAPRCAARSAPGGRPRGNDQPLLLVGSADRRHRLRSPS